jgi:hypothetical protein
MAREYSQSGRESNGAGAIIDKLVCAVSAECASEHGGGDKLCFCFAKVYLAGFTGATSDDPVFGTLEKML